MSTRVCQSTSFVLWSRLLLRVYYFPCLPSLQRPWRAPLKDRRVRVADVRCCSRYIKFKIPNLATLGNPLVTSLPSKEPIPSRPGMYWIETDYECFVAYADSWESASLKRDGLKNKLKYYFAVTDDDNINGGKTVHPENNEVMYEYFVGKDAGIILHRQLLKLSLHRRDIVRLTPIVYHRHL